MNQPEKGIEFINQHIEDLASNIRALSHTARCEANLGNKGRAYELLTTLLHIKSKPDQYVSEVYIADVFAELGDKEKALSWLDKGIENESPENTMFIHKPVYDQWRDEPEYRALLKKANLDKP